MNQVAGPRGCFAYYGDLKVRIETANAYYYPDVVLSCAQDPESVLASTPVIVVEVLSESTARTDRQEKVPAYQTVASIRMILLVAQTERRIEAWTRDGAGWRIETVEEEGALWLEPLGMALSLDEVYR